MLLQEGEALLAPAAGALGGTVAVLSAMILPAVLISACGSLAISTSNRLSRTIDRVRRLGETFGTLAAAASATTDDAALAANAEQRAMLFDQLERATRRARMLQRAMTCLYLAIGAFVAASVAVGVLVATGSRFAWVPAVLGVAGAALLLSAAVLLIVESQVALRAIDNEMEFAWQSGRRHVPDAVAARLEARAARRWWRRRS